MGGSFKELFAKIEKTLSFKKEKAKIDFTIELQSLMKKNQVTRADLARELNKSNAYVTQILRGERNFTIETMVELADALDSDLAIHFSPKGENTVDWYRVIQSAPGRKRTSARASSRKIDGLTVEDCPASNAQNNIFFDFFDGREADGYAIAT
jgi:transcriptional regulator with XRE-family HTH domain